MAKGRGGNQGHGGGRGGGRGRGRRDQSELRCYECGDLGHFAYECTKWKAKDEEKKNEALFVEQDNDRETTLF
ncbi:hypothetical protein E3N88_30638 [Mikania micrantha]|uniref:CCHC-type domain-containing protein n=1 Tax=Mikania micrantha TaxID=192012 RepID=A0A5N6MQ75_9ASTR|nr:hypothetical protein E3N88_30638 [Mikania micrantha]